MKILFPIMSFYPAQSGGPSNTIYWHAKELVGHQLEPFVVTTDNDIQDSTIIRNKWTTLDQFKVIYTRNYNNKYAYNLTLAAIKKLKEVDMVHFSSLFYPPNMVIAVFALMYNKKIILSTRGELESFALSQGRSKLKVLAIHIYKMLCRNILFHGTSKSEIENIHKTFKNLGGCVEISNFMQLPDRIVTDKKNQFLFVGRINRIKALHKIIEGFGLSEKFRKSNYSFCIAGKGDHKYLDELQKQTNILGLEHKIKILGKSIEGLEKEKIYAESKFLMLLSESENFGNVVIEAMAQATPAITSFGTPWAVLNDNKIGYHINNASTNITKIINEVIDLEEQEYEAISENSFKYVKDNFDVKTNIQKWVTIYQKLAL
tara:strand:- start:11676 stop:12797 length:1122 start_codon:yes stop_codon:yes gene_type:complete